MPPGATVQTAAVERICPDCKRTIEPTRRYCDRDRDRRRALTFLGQADSVLAHMQSDLLVDRARHHVAAARMQLDA